MADILPFRRRPRHRFPPNWQRRRAPSGIVARDIRIMIWAGLILGLLLFQALRGWSVLAVQDEPLALQRPAQDPWAESRLSRAILRPQEAGQPQNGRSSGYAPAADAPSRRAAARADSGVQVGTAPVSGSVHVIDGDTFDHGGERIRIADIDTPELNGRCAEESQLAAAATRRLRSLLEAGPFELVPVERDEDRYGRKLRIVLRGRRSIGDMLVAEGLARTWSGRREPWCA